MEHEITCMQQAGLVASFAHQDMTRLSEVALPVIVETKSPRLQNLGCCEGIS